MCLVNQVEKLLISNYPVIELHNSFPQFFYVDENTYLLISLNASPSHIDDTIRLLFVYFIDLKIEYSTYSTIDLNLTQPFIIVGISIFMNLI